MDALFTPWRLEFILSAKDGTGAGCIFCNAFAAGPSRENLVLWTGVHAAVMVNKYPYNNGHLLIFPRAHVDSLTGLSAAELEATQREMALAEKVLRESYRPDGLNLGMNLGRAGGAGIADHVHWHVLPRWIGDANFLTTVVQVRLIPEVPEQTWDRLRSAYSTR